MKSKAKNATSQVAVSKKKAQDKLHHESNALQAVELTNASTMTKPSKKTTKTHKLTRQQEPQQWPTSQLDQSHLQKPATIDVTKVGASKPSSVEWTPVIYKKRRNPARTYANLVAREYALGIDRREAYGMPRDDERIWEWLEGVPEDVECCVEEI